MKTFVPLAPIDYVFTGRNSYPIEFVFLYERQLDSKKIEQALHQTLSRFGPMQGTLVQSANNTFSFRIDEKRFLFGVETSTLDFKTASKQDFYHHLDSVESLVDEPLLKIKLTHGATGSALAVSASHAVVDGYSYFYFLSCWAKVARGETFSEPDHSREKLIPENISESQVLNQQLILEKTGLHTTSKRSDISRNKIKWVSEFISTQEKQELIVSASEVNKPLSFNDLLCASLWKKYAPLWRKDNTESMAYMGCPVDLRRHVPKTSALYFGNAICAANASATYEELAKLSVPMLALRIRDAVGGINEDFAFRSFQTLASYRQQNGIDAFETFHVAHPRHGMIVTNLSRLPLTELDFGFGAPWRSEILTSAPRACVVLSHKMGTEVQICLPRDMP